VDDQYQFPDYLVFKRGMILHIYNPSIQEAEGLQIPGYLG
jgi:hypothetical protein